MKSGRYKALAYALGAMLFAQLLAVRPVPVHSGRQTSTEYRSGGVTGSLVATEYASFDAAGNRTEFRSARSSSATDTTYRTTFGYDDANHLTSVTQPVDATTSITTSYGFDTNGNTTRVTDGRGNLTTYTYNPWQLLESVIEPSTPAHPATADRTFTTTYDAGGLAIKDTVPGTAGTPITVTRSFDELGRLVTETGAGSGAATAQRSFGYDLAGRMDSWSHPDGTITATYDDRGLLLSTSAPGSSAVASSFGYDAAGRMTRRTDAAGTTNFTYTPSRGQLDTIADPITDRTLDYAYNDAGQPSQVTYTGVAGVARTFGYDDRGRLASDSLAAGATNRYTTEYVYEKDGDVKEQKITIGAGATATHAYTYDRSGRLAKWTKPDATFVNYAYDGAGNRTAAGATTYSYDARNRLANRTVGASTTTYGWSARGTLATVTPPLGTPTVVAYDALDRLASHGTTTYSYDSFDRVARRGATEAFTYAGRELDFVQGPSAAVTYGRDPSGALVSARNGAIERLAGLNRHGDLAWVADDALAVTDTRTYDPHGNTFASTGTIPVQLGYQADYTDPSTAAVWMGARWYDPATATFGSRDSVAGMLRTPVSLNRYTYAHADPLAYFDPDGHWPAWANAVVGTVWSGIQAIGGAIYDYVIKPIVGTVSAGARAVLSVAATAYRTSRRAAVGLTQRISSATNLIRQAIVTKARQRLESVRAAASTIALGIDKAARAAYRCFDGLHATCTTIAAGVAAGLAVGAVCTTGIGCAVLAGVAGGAVSGGLGCKPGQNLGRCVLVGGALGGATAGVVYGGSALVRSALGRTSSGIGRGVASVADDVERGIAPQTTRTAGQTVRRFVRQGEYDEIGKAISSGADEVSIGRYFTPDDITDPAVATQRLALPGTDVNPLVGYVDVPISSLPSEPLARFGPRLVNSYPANAAVRQPGLGLETVVSELYGNPIVPTHGLRLVGF